MVLEIGRNKLPDKSEFFTKGECMVYFNNEEIIIRDMIFSDGLHFTDEERKQGWDSTIDKFEMRLKDVKNGKCISLVADYYGIPAGYVNVYPDS